MTIYTIIPEGGCKCGGSADFDLSTQINTRFTTGDIAYPKYKAANGILEEIAIKYPYTDLQLDVKYIDTYNGRWEESELLTYEEALDMAEAYLERKLGCG